MAHDVVVAQTWPTNIEGKAVMIIVKKLSAWEYETSASGGIGIGLVAAEGGAIWLYDPKRLRQRFRYGGVGAGLSWGIKIPRVPKIQI
jgi:hypothetical protein